MNDEQTHAVSHSAAARALEALFVGGDEEAAFEEVPAGAVFRHLQGCEACRERFDGLAYADRYLAGADGEMMRAEPGDFEDAFAEASFASALDGMLAAERRDQARTSHEDDPKASPEGGVEGGSVLDFEPSPSAEEGARPYGQYAVAAAVVLLAAASLVWLSPTVFDGGDDGFSPRSASSPTGGGDAEAASAHQVGVQAFCAERTSEGVEFTGPAEAPLGLVGCPLDAELKLAYRNRSPEFRYAAFFGVDQKGTIYWYGPTPSAREPVGIDAGDRLRPVGESIRLEVNHRPGSVRVVGVFSAEPIDFERLEGLVEGVDTEALFAGQRPAGWTGSEALTTTTFEVTDGGLR